MLAMEYGSDKCDAAGSLILWQWTSYGTWGGVGGLVRWRGERDVYGVLNLGEGKDGPDSRST